MTAVPVGGGEVQAGVEAVAARAVAVADRRVDRAAQRGGGHWRPGERGERRRAGDAVGGEAGEGLQAADARSSSARRSRRRPCPTGSRGSRARTAAPRRPSRARRRSAGGCRPGGGRASPGRGASAGRRCRRRTRPARAWMRRTPLAVPGPASPSTAPVIDGVGTQRDLQGGDTRAGGECGRGSEKARRDRRRRHPGPERQHFAQGVLALTIESCPRARFGAAASGAAARPGDDARAVARART